MSVDNMCVMAGAAALGTIVYMNCKSSSVVAPTQCSARAAKVDEGVSAKRAVVRSDLWWEKDDAPLSEGFDDQMNSVQTVKKIPPPASSLTKILNMESPLIKGTGVNVQIAGRADPLKPKFVAQKRGSADAVMPFNQTESLIMAQEEEDEDEE